MASPSPPPRSGHANRRGGGSSSGSSRSVRRAIFLLLVACCLLVSRASAQCMQVVEPTQDAVPKPRLRTRSGATEDNPLLPQPAADKPAGCAVPLIFEVSEGQRKKELALGISVRTSVGDSEEFESDTLEFMPGSQVNITVPIVACGEELLGVIVRIVGNQTATAQTLLIDRLSSTYMGELQRSSFLCDGSPFVLNKYRSLIDLAGGF